MREPMPPRSLAMRTLFVVSLLLTGGLAGYLCGRTSSSVENGPQTTPNDFDPVMNDDQTNTSISETRNGTRAVPVATNDPTATGSLLDNDLEQLRLIRSFDPDELVAFLHDSLIAGPQVSWALIRLVELDADAALGLLLGDPKFDGRISELFQALSRIDLERGIAMVEQLPMHLRQTAAQGLLNGVPAMDLGDFLALQKRLGRNTNRGMELAGWADRMMEKDPLQGWAQLLSHGMENDSDRANFMTYAFVWYRNDPLTALDAITSIENPVRNDVITMLKGSLGGTNSELLIDWLNRQDRTLQDEMMPELLGHYAQVDPRAALNQAAALNGELRSNAERNIIRNWATVDPRAAIDWVLADRQQADRAERFTEATRTFAFRAPDEAMEWATAIDNPELRESALIGIATTGAQPYLHPGTALAAAAKLDDPDSRTRYAREAYAAWSKYNEPAATLAVREQFSEDELAGIMTAPADQ